MSRVAYAIELAQRPKVRRLGIRLSYTLLSLVVIVDQLLLPMFRVGPVPFKISYLVLGFWLIHWMSRSRIAADESRDIKRVFGAFAVILACILIGELWLASAFQVQSYYEATKGVLAFIFAAFAFGLGRSSRRFRMEWLIPILFTAIILNLLFIIFQNDLPSWLIHLYVPERATSNQEGFRTVEEIIALTRPRGIFGNPNASMLMVNVLVLFIHLGIRNKVLKIRSAITASSLLILPVFLAAIFASRGEFLAALSLALLNYHALRSGHGRSLRKVTTILLILIVAVGAIFLSRIGDGLDFITNVERIYKLGALIEVNQGEDKASTIQRPLIAMETFIGRFPRSPLFGTGISAADADHLSEGTQYFHNDWMYVLAISGLLGFFALLWLLQTFISRLGWPILIPFFLPGLVNTFMLNIPAFIAYFGMAGVLLALVQQRAISDVLH